MTSRLSRDNQILQLTREDIAFMKPILEKMQKCDNEIHTELTNLSQVMSHIGSPVQQSVGVLDQLLSNQSRVFPPFTHFQPAKDFLPSVQPTSNRTLVEPQPPLQESDNVNEDQNQKKQTIISINFCSCKDI